MMIPLRLLALLPFLLVLAGCPDRSVAGHYAGKRLVREGPAHIVGPLSKVDLVLEREGKFKLMNLSLTFEGDWTFDGDRIELEVKSIANRPAEPSAPPFLVRKGQSWEFVDPAGTDPTPVLLDKVP